MATVFQKTIHQPTSSSNLLVALIILNGLQKLILAGEGVKAHEKIYACFNWPIFFIFSLYSRIVKGFQFLPDTHC